MNTAVATKMPTRSPEATSAGRMGDTKGRNSAGRELARKNSPSGPRSSTSLSTGLSCGFCAVGFFGFMGGVCNWDREELLSCPGRVERSPLAKRNESRDPAQESRSATPFASKHRVAPGSRLFAVAWPGHDPLFNPRNRAREIVGGKRREIVDPLAHADEVHGQPVLGGNGHQNPAARGAVELGHHQPGDPRDIAEYLDLRQRVLP